MKEIVVADGMLAVETIKAIKHYEKRMKKLEDEYKAFKGRLLEVMEANDLIKVEADGLTITYIAPTERETFDTKAFRKDNPDLYDEYARLTSVNAIVRIAVK